MTGDVTAPVAERRRPLEILVLAATVVAIASFLVRETLDADTWWQVAIGRDIVANLAIPRFDRFAAAALGRPYHDSHWLFQVVLALVDRVGGMRGVSLLMVGLWSATFIATFRALRRWVSVTAACLIVFAVAVACSDRFTPRPDVVSCLCIALFYLRLQERRYRSLPDRAFLVFLQIVWSNSHGLFVIGPFMAGCYLVGEAVRSREERAPSVRALALLCILLAASTFATPFGFGGWTYAFLLMQEAGPGGSRLFKTLPELMPTFGAGSLRLPDVWFFSTIAAGAVVAAAVATVKGRLSLSRFLIVAFLGVAAATGRRNMPLLALTAAPFCAEHLAFLGLRLRPPALKVVAAVCLVALSWLPLSGRYYHFLGYPIRSGVGATRGYFPLALPDFLHRNGFSGVVFNSNSLGGFCLYHGFRPVTDGRWEVYDEAVLREAFDAPGNPESWDRLLSRYDVRGVMLAHQSPEGLVLVPRLRNDLRWRLVYYDGTASFWMRNDLPSLPPRSAAPAVLPERVEEYLMLSTFCRLMGEPQAALSWLGRALPLNERREAVLAARGDLQRDVGNAVAAEETYRALLQVNPKNVPALNELAYFAYARGDRHGAEAYLRRALEVDPSDGSARANFAIITGGAPPASPVTQR